MSVLPSRASMAADLPVVLWSRQKVALSAGVTETQRAGLDAVMSFSRKTVIDTVQSNVKEAFEVVDSWKKSGRIVADLEWTRLTPWREALAAVFDDPVKQKNLWQYKSVQIGYLGSAPSAGVLYLGAWLKSVLGAKVTFVEATQGVESGLQDVLLRSDGDEIELKRTSQDCMTLRNAGREQRYNYPDLSLYSLMNEELSVLGPDLVFDQAFSQAQELLQA